MATSHYYYTLNAIIKNLFKELNALNNSLIAVYEEKNFKLENFNNLYAMSSLIQDNLTHLKEVINVLNNKTER